MKCDAKYGSTQDLLMEAYQRSMRRLDSQQSVALASDQRGIVAAGISLAGATLAANVGGSEGVYRVVSVGAFVFSAITAMISARPQSFYTSGSHARDLSSAIKQKADIVDVLRALCEGNDEYIDENEKFAKDRSNKFEIAIGAFCMGAIFLLLSAMADILGGTPA